MTNLVKFNLITFKPGKQLAEINGKTYRFEFSESDLAESIEANIFMSELSHRSGLHQDDYSAKEMAIEIASYWETSDVEDMIAALPADELDYYLVSNTQESEVSHAA